MTCVVPIIMRMEPVEPDDEANTQLARALDWWRYEPLPRRRDPNSPLVAAAVAKRERKAARRLALAMLAVVLMVTGCDPDFRTGTPPVTTVQP